MTRKTRMIFVEEVTDTGTETVKDSNLFESFEVDVENVKTDLPKPDKPDKKHKKASRKKSDEKKKEGKSANQGSIKSVSEKSLKVEDADVEDQAPSPGQQKRQKEGCTREITLGESSKSSLSLSIKRLPKLFASASSEKRESFSSAAVTGLTPAEPATSANASPQITRDGSFPPASTSTAAAPPALFRRGRGARGGGGGGGGAGTKISACLETNEMKTILDSLLYQKLRNLFISMMITGIFFVRQQKTSPGSKTR